MSTLSHFMTTNPSTPESPYPSTSSSSSTPSTADHGFLHPELLQPFYQTPNSSNVNWRTSCNASSPGREWRPFTCQYCSKKFKRKDHLKDHEKLHTGERPYTCEYCGRGFVQRSNCKIHSIRCMVLHQQANNNNNNNTWNIIYSCVCFFVILNILYLVFICHVSKEIL